MKAKRLIEVAMPIKEISAESQRDKSIRHGHISTLHLWWARRPLPACRAVVFGSLVPDPLDENCPQAFKDAVNVLLMRDVKYKPYADIPYTAAYDPMEDNLRNRLLLFIGKFTDSCQRNLIAGRNTPPAEQITPSSLVKYEARNDRETVDIARKLIFVAYNAELNPNKSFDQLSAECDVLLSRVYSAIKELERLVNRHCLSEEAMRLQNEVDLAIEAFQGRMPIVFDPFAGGGAIPLEAARLGCRSYGNDNNPVAHIVEIGSATFPQKYGKSLRITREEFQKTYGSKGETILRARNDGLFEAGIINIPNRIAFDVEFYANEILDATREKVGYQYPSDSEGRPAIAYYWARTAKCANPSCGARVPLLRNFYLCFTPSKKVYLKPIVNGKNISFTIETGKYDDKQMPSWNHRGTMTCPCCGSVTDIESVKDQSLRGELEPDLIAMISESDAGKYYSIPSNEAREILMKKPQVEYRPSDPMTRNSNGGDTFP